MPAAPLETSSSCMGSGLGAEKPSPNLPAPCLTVSPAQRDAPEVEVKLAGARLDG